MIERKKRIEHKLGKLGVNVEKMQEATEELERPYCHTKEREEKRRIKKKKDCRGSRRTRIKKGKSCTSC